MAAFLVQARDQPRLGPAHISLYAALLVLHGEQNVQPLRIKRAMVVALAKISPATYHACLRTLVECGFLVYYPCCDANKGSEIYLVSAPIEKKASIAVAE